MEHLELGDITPRDIGNRVLVTDGESVVDGTLAGLWAATDHKGEPYMQHVSIKTATGEFKLNRVPLDYVVQIDRRTGDDYVIENPEADRGE